MQSEPVEIDHLNLKEMLDALIIDISVPYLEKKGKIHFCKAIPAEELPQIVQNLSKRERDLKALAGIANMLLENNQILQSEKELMSNKFQSKKESILRLKEKLNFLENDALVQETKKLENAKEIIIDLTLNNEELRKELQNLKDWPNIHNETISEYQSKIDTLEEEYATQLKDARMGSQNFQDKLSQERSARAILQEKYVKAKEKNRKLSEEMRILTPKVKCLQNKVEKYTRMCLELEESNEQLRKSNDNYKTKLNKVEKKSKTVGIIYSKFEHFSSCDEEESTENPLSLRSELQEAFTEIKNQKEVFLKPTYKRKTPTEEFFFLTTQAIIVNHPYMQSIFTVSIKDLYCKAMQEGIPFYHWHFWIGRELTQYAFRNYS